MKNPVRSLNPCRKFRFLGVLSICLGMCSSVLATPVYHKMAAGLLEVIQVSPLDTNLADVNLTLGVGNFQPVSANRADYTVSIGVGTAAADDATLGVLMTSVAENGRDNFGTNAYPTSCFVVGDNGLYRIVTFLGQGATAGQAIEYNVNVAAAWFPFDTYLGGYGFNSDGINGGTTDSFIGSPALSLGTHLISLGSGRFVVDLRSLGIDSRTDGVLLVSHAKEENNYALSQVNTTNGTWSVFVKDNANPTASAFEQDPVAFVFIPKTNTMVVSGRFLADGTPEMFSGATPQFTVTPLETGRWGLKVNGGSPAKGVLIISPEGGRSLNQDNIVNYEPNAAGDGWEIESRDTPLNGLQTPTGEPVVSFVYIPAATPGVAVTPETEMVTGAGGGTAKFSVVLDSRPSADVNIAITSGDPSKGVASPSSLRFRPGEWEIPQTVTVTGQSSLTPSITPYVVVLAPATSQDPGYNQLNPADVTLLFIPWQAVSLYPTNGDGNTSISPTLQVGVTNGTGPGGLTVTLYGREAEVSAAGEDFSIAVLPDTQMYTAEKGGGTKEMLVSQIEWVITNRVSNNVVYVTQLGDLINDGDIYLGLPNITQWRNATNAMYRLENPVRTMLPDGISYGIAVGNHEMEPIGDPTGTTTYYNQYFGVNRFLGRSYYGGHWGTNNNNHYDLFSASGLDFIVIYFEYNTSPQPELLAWANNLLQTNPNRRAIIITHNMGNTQTPVSVSPQWTAIYNSLKTNSNMFLMLAGHVTGQGSRVDTFNGNTVRTFVQDYQGWTNGGSGFMRLYTFSPSNNVVVVQTFSPWTGEWLTDEKSEFYFDYNMQPGASVSSGTPFVAMSTNTGVVSGSVLELPWAGLERNKRYEWYVSLTDGSGIATTSPIWQFTTAATNQGPIVANMLKTITGDGSTLITLNATDPNNDPLTFQVVAMPTRGLLQGFDPSAGTVTYTPARGFRGSDHFTFKASDGEITSSTALINLTVVAPLDSDGNGLPDDWELAYGVTDPNGDDDGDGQNNLSEYMSNTNPTNDESALRITSAAPLTNGFFGLSWASVGGTRYRVQFSNGPGVNDGFTDLPRDLLSEMDSNTVGVPGTKIFVDDLTLAGPATNGARYYRVRVTQ